MPSGMAYDAFISYSHAADRPVALAVQRGLHRLAKRWYQVRALRVFRDDTSLSANPHLWAAIEQGLRGSRHFVLMASPEAANSHWVGKEIAYWQQNREPETFLIVHTKGTIAWDAAANDFDWTRTDALPRSLSGWFHHEPLWVALDEKRRSEGLSLRNATFRGAVCQLAAPVRGVAPDELDSEDIRRHRVASRVRSAAITALSLLLVTATALGLVALSQRDEARTQARIAGARALAAEADVLAGGDPVLSARLSLAAYRLDPTAIQSRQSLLRALDRNRHVARFLLRAPLDAGDGDFGSTASELGSLAVSGNGSLIAVGEGHTGRVGVFDAASGRELAVLKPPSGAQRTGPVMWFSPDDKLLNVATANHISEWDTASWQPRAQNRHEMHVDGVIQVATHRTFLSTGARFDAPAGSPTIEAAGNQVFAVDAQFNRTELLYSLPNSVSDIALSADGAVGAALDLSGNLVVLRTKADHRYEVLPAEPLTGPNSPGLTVSPDGRRLVVEREGKVELWQLDDRHKIAEFPTSVPYPAGSLDSPTAEFSPDSTLFAYDTGDRISVRGLDGQEVRAEPVATSPRDRAKTTAEALRSGYLTRQPENGQNYTVHAITPAGSRRVAGGMPSLQSGSRRDRAAALMVKESESAKKARITTWLLGDGDFDEVGAVDVEGSFWSNIEVSADGRFVALSEPTPWHSLVIDMTTGARTEFTAGPGQAAGGSAFTFTGNNELVVEHVQPNRYYDYGGRVLLWDRPSGALIGELDDHALRPVNPHDVVLGVAAVSSSGLVNVRDDGGLVVWRIQPDDWARSLCALAGDFDDRERAKYLEGFEVGRLCR